MNIQGAVDWLLSALFSLIVLLDEMGMDEDMYESEEEYISPQDHGGYRAW